MTVRNHIRVLKAFASWLQREGLPGGTNVPLEAEGAQGPPQGDADSYARGDRQTPWLPQT